MGKVFTKTVLSNGKSMLSAICMNTLNFAAHSCFSPALHMDSVESARRDLL